MRPLERRGKKQYTLPKLQHPRNHLVALSWHTAKAPGFVEDSEYLSFTPNVDQWLKVREYSLHYQATANLRCVATRRNRIGHTRCLPAYSTHYVPPHSVVHGHTCHGRGLERGGSVIACKYPRGLCRTIWQNVPFVLPTASQESASKPVTTMRSLHWTATEATSDAVTSRCALVFGRIRATAREVVDSFPRQRFVSCILRGQHFDRARPSPWKRRLVRRPYVHGR